MLLLLTRKWSDDSLLILSPRKDIQAAFKVLETVKIMASFSGGLSDDNIVDSISLFLLVKSH